MPAPQAAFYLYPDFSPLADVLLERHGITSDEGLAAVLLHKYGVGVLPGSAFGEESGRLRLRVATAMLYGDTDTERARRAELGRPVLAALDRRVAGPPGGGPGRPHRLTCACGRSRWFTRTVNQHATARGALAVGALGVVFGDIGTSPLYTVQTVFNPSDPHPVKVSTESVFGIVSLIFWSVTIIVTVTYVLLVMRADNDGEGGIMALITLIRDGESPAAAGRRSCSRRWGSSAPRCSSATA